MPRRRFAQDAGPPHRGNLPRRKGPPVTTNSQLYSRKPGSHRHPMHRPITRAILLAILLSVGALSLIGCGQQESKPVAKKTTPVSESTNPADLEPPDELNDELSSKLAQRRKSGAHLLAKRKPAAPEAPQRTPAADEQWCFECEAKGVVKCLADTCKAGRLPCPGPCIHPGRGNWVPDPNHPGQLGYKLQLGGNRYAMVSYVHAGEVFAVQNGEAVPLGKCPTCKGFTTLPCRTCSGKGTVNCPVCQGTKIVAAAWKPTDNPWFNTQPDVIRLKDGRVFLGRESGGGGDTVIFKTRDGQFITVNRDQILQAPAKQ
jgi:hypothetical protein